MTFSALEHHMEHSAPDRIPGALHEMNAAVKLAKFLNRTTGTHYDSVDKDADMENDGVDAHIYNSQDKSQSLYVQVTRAREYDMSPDINSGHNEVNVTGQPVIDAILYKCSIYRPRGVYTHGIVLLVVGVTPVGIIREHVERGELSTIAPEESCFQSVYYTTGNEVVKLV